MGVSLPEGMRMQETRRLARVLEIIQQISTAPERWNRKSLAAAHEVGERQIQRDLEMIRHRLRLDLRRTRSGYLLRGAPRLPVVSYTLSEALALLLAAQSAREYGVDAAELSSAIGRLESVFPAEFRPLLREAAAATRGAAGGRLERDLMILQRALASRRKVRLAYDRDGGDAAPIDRVVHPYCLLPRDRSWYLVAHCELRDEVRTFKVDRILDARLLDEPYQVPDGFDVAALAGPSWGLMWGSAGTPEEVSLEFSAQAGRWVAEEQWHFSQVVSRLEDGRYRVTFRVGVTPEFVRWLMWFGRDVRVLRPEWLREQVAAEHRAAAEG